MVGDARYNCKGCGVDLFYAYQTDTTNHALQDNGPGPSAVESSDKDAAAAAAEAALYIIPDAITAHASAAQAKAQGPGAPVAAGPLGSTVHGDEQSEEAALNVSNVWSDLFKRYSERSGD